MSKVSKKRKRIETFALINPHAAGIDISDKEHVVAVAPDCCQENVRTFNSFTVDLVQIVEWLKACQVVTVAMESTCVYWVHLFVLLQEQGFEVILVNAKHVKNVTGRKDDDLDAAWIQKLHSCGLLQASFQPPPSLRALRSTVRHRKSFIRDGARYLNRVQKALELMNIKLHTVISDIAGKTGQSIIQAIIWGERSPEKLAEFTNPRIKAPKQEIIKSLQGCWREEHLFELRQWYQMYQLIREKIKASDQFIEQQLQQWIAEKNDGVWEPIDTKTKRKRSGKNATEFNLTAYLNELLGVTVTEITGISELSVLEIVAEAGTDLSKWKNHKHFASWLGLAPNTKKSAGKVISSKIRKKKHFAGQAFKMAASIL